MTLGVLILLLATSAARSQPATRVVAIDSVRQGERLRAGVMGQDHYGRAAQVWVEGWLSSRNADSLRMTTPGDGHVALRRSDLLGLQVARGRLHPFITDVLIGAAVGATLGILASGTSSSGTKCVAGVCTPPKVPPKTRNTVTGAVAGASVGIAFGFYGKTAWLTVQ